MPFGSVITNQTAPFYEQYLSANWSGVQIGQGQSWQPGLGGITMPFYGEIFVDLWVQVSYTYTILRAEVWPATPIAPSNYYAGKVCEWDRNGGYFTVPMFGRWAPLAAGTYFDLTIQVRDIVSDGVCGIVGFAAIIRAQAY